MKMTKSQLRQIIKEELEAVMTEATYPTEVEGVPIDGDSPYDKAVKTGIFTPTGGYQILDPNNPADVDRFKLFEIYDSVTMQRLNTYEKIKAAAKKSEEERIASERRLKPSGNSKWVYLASHYKNEHYGWEYYDTTRAKDYQEIPERKDSKVMNYSSGFSE